MDDSKNVLFVDDDDDLREAIADLLLAAGADDCVAVGSLVELQARSGEAFACSLAILDVNLGVGCPDGVEVFHWLRRSGYGSPIAFMTGHAASHPSVVRALTLPSTAILIKPVSIEKIAALLHDA